MEPREVSKLVRDWLSARGLGWRSVKGYRTRLDDFAMVESVLVKAVLDVPLQTEGVKEALQELGRGGRFHLIVIGSDSKSNTNRLIL